MEENKSVKQPDVDMQWFPCSQQNAPGTSTDQLHRDPADPGRPLPPSLYPPFPSHKHSLPVMLQCLAAALQVLRQTNENCRLMSSIAGCSAEWDAHYNDHFAENHASLQAECQKVLAQQYAIITSPVNAVHPVEQLDAKHHSTEEFPIQKGRRMYTIGNDNMVHDQRNGICRVENGATSDTTELCEDPWPDADIPGLASVSMNSEEASSFTNGRINGFPAGVPKHANLFCNKVQHILIFTAVLPVFRQIIVAIGTNSSPGTTSTQTAAKNSLEIG